MSEDEMEGWVDNESSAKVTGAWMPLEDTLLTLHVEKNEMKVINWRLISLNIPGRSPKQCRERWKCNLDPRMNKDKWTDQEDIILVQFQLSLGNRWSLIAKKLPGRSENAIKTRFRSIQRAQKKAWSAEEDQQILNMRLNTGAKWEHIADFLPKRSKNAVRIRFKELAVNLPSKKKSCITVASLPESESPDVSMSYLPGLQGNKLMRNNLTWPCKMYPPILNAESISEFNTLLNNSLSSLPMFMQSLKTRETGKNTFFTLTAT